MAFMDPLIENVERTVERHGLLPGGGGPVLLAVSGGPDSLALLHAMASLRRKRSGLRLRVGHLHHGMRGPAADADARFVENAAAELDIPCTVGRADVPGLARERGMGVEAAGRAARYEFLEALAREVGAGRIATGHQADDQAETVLMRVMRGAGPRGMGAIPYMRAAHGGADLRIIRPLLDCRRAEIEAFLRRRGAVARLDATNLLPDPLRNRVRRELLPAVEKDWPGALRSDLCALAALAQRMQRQAEALCDLLAPRAMRHEAGCLHLDAAALAGAPALLPEILRRGLREAGLAGRAFSREHYERIARLMEARTGVVSLPGAVLAEREGGSLTIRRHANAEEDFCVEVRVPGETPIPPLRGRLIAETLAGGRDCVDARRDAMEEFLDADRVALPLSARFPRPGDRMRPLGAPGTRKVQDILTDLHIPSWRKARTLVVTSAGRPIWLVGIRIADDVKLSAQTRRVLRLRWELEG